MKTVTRPNHGFRIEQLKTITREMGKKLTDEKRRPWYLEAAISLTIALLGTALLLASAKVI